jgi:hypothetical protein
VHFVFEDRPIVLSIRQHGIWSSSEIVDVFLRYRSTFTRLEDIDDYPTHAATPDEAELVEGMLALSLYFFWGVEIFSDKPDIFVRTSHDEYMNIYVQDAARFAEIKDAMENYLKLEPYNGPF